MQAVSRWTPPSGPLGRLTAAARLRAAELASRRDDLASQAAVAAAAPSFVVSLRQGDTVAVIAEVKRRSPSKGAINPGLDAAERAAAYQRGGAAALSILTEPVEFGGAPEDLSRARACVSLPLLRKDFIVSDVQIAEARALGASAVLLIARALAPEDLTALAGAAAGFGIEVLVEVRDEWELERAIAITGAAIGVNNRNLETLQIDPEVSRRIIPRIPPDRVAVYESGVSGRADVERAAGLGADAVLVGSSISAATDAAGAVAALTGVARRPRGA